jgi:hypothetical protein
MVDRYVSDDPDLGEFVRGSDDELMKVMKGGPGENVVAVDEVMNDSYKDYSSTTTTTTTENVYKAPPVQGSSVHQPAEGPETGLETDDHVQAPNVANALREAAAEALADPETATSLRGYIDAVNQQDAGEAQDPDTRVATSEPSAPPSSAVPPDDLRHPDCGGYLVPSPGSVRCSRCGEAWDR